MRIGVNTSFIYCRCNLWERNLYVIYQRLRTQWQFIFDRVASFLLIGVG